MAEDPSNPDVVFTSGFDQKSFQKSATWVLNQITKLQNQIIASQTKLQAAQGALNSATTQQQTTQLNKQIAQYQTFIAATTQKLGNFQQLHATAMNKLQAGFGGAFQNIQTQHSSMLGNMNKDMGKFLVSLGFTIRQFRDIPGLREIGVFTAASGFGGGAGLGGAAAGLAIGATLEGARELVSLYTELAKQASQVRERQAEFNQDLAASKDIVHSSMLPLLTDIQEIEIKMLAMFVGHRGDFDHLVEVFSKLVESSLEFGKNILLMATGSETTDKAVDSIIGRFAQVVGITTAIVNRVDDLLTKHPILSFLNPAGLVGGAVGGAIGGAARSSILNSIGSAMYGVPGTPVTAPSNTPVGVPDPLSQRYISGMSDYWKQQGEEFQEKDVLARKAEENRLKAVQLELLKSEYAIDAVINDLNQKKEESLNRVVVLASDHVADLEKQLHFEQSISDERIASINKEIAASKQNQSIALGRIGELQGSPFDTLADQESQREKITQYKDQEVQAEKKRDEEIAQSKIRLHQAVIQIINAEIEAQKRALDNKVADTNAERQRAIAVMRTLNAIHDLNMAQRGITNDSGSSLAVSSMFPGELKLGPDGMAQRSSLSSDAIEILQRAALQKRQQDLESQIAQSQSKTQIGQNMLERSTDPNTRQQLTRAIRESKDAEIEFNNQLIITLQLQQALTEPGTEKFNKLNEAILDAQSKIEGLGKKTHTAGDLLRSTFELITSRASAFRSELGKSAVSAASLGKSILDLSKVKFPGSDTETGSISGGFKAAFTNEQGGFSATSALTQGIPMVAGIASAAIGLVSSLRDLFSKAAKQMAQSINDEVSGIVKSTETSGEIAKGLAELENERIKALGELSNRKGGQKQLDTLLPSIDQAIDSLKQKQKTIVDSFNDSLAKLRLGAPFDSIYDSVNAAQKQIEDYLKSVDDVDAHWADVQEFMKLTFDKMSKDWQDRMNAELKSWDQGAENAAGQLISIDQEAMDEIGRENTNFNKAEIQRSKSLADVKKAYAKQEADDIKKIADLQTQLSDLNSKETTDVLAIQNEGIAERQKTTSADKRQRIADLQDQTKKERIAIQDQISDIQDARVERAIAYNEQLTQMQEVEDQAVLDHKNLLSRIDLETERRRQQHLENMQHLQEEKTFIDQMTQNQSDFLNQWLAAFKGMPSGGSVNVGQIILNIRTDADLLTKDPTVFQQELTSALTGALNTYAVQLATNNSH